MKMSGGVTRACVALFFVLTSVSAVQKSLKSINDLKKINFDTSVSKHSLVLLYWFANTVDMNNNNIIRLTFDPNRDYGSHHYGNFEGLLEPLPRGNSYRYFTVGNLQERDTQNRMLLPSYVAHPPRVEFVGRNMDRIIFRTREQNTVDQVYITQHYDTSEQQGTRYDPDHTYQITTYLLRQIREFSVGGNQQSLLQLRNRYGSNADNSQLRNMWGELTSLGLLLFIVIQEKYSSTQDNNRRGNRQNHLDDDPPKRERKRESNVPRPFKDHVAVNIDDWEDYRNNRINNVKDHRPYRMTENRESGMSRCCICCICFTCCIVALGIALGVYFSLFYKRG